MGSKKVCPGCDGVRTPPKGRTGWQLDWNYQGYCEGCYNLGPMTTEEVVEERERQVSAAAYHLEHGKQLRYDQHLSHLHCPKGSLNQDGTPMRGSVRRAKRRKFLRELWDKRRKDK